MAGAARASADRDTRTLVRAAFTRSSVRDSTGLDVAQRAVKNTPRRKPRVVDLTSSSAFERLSSRLQDQLKELAIPSTDSILALRLFAVQGHHIEDMARPRWEATLGQLGGGLRFTTASGHLSSLGFPWSASYPLAAAMRAIATTDSSIDLKLAAVRGPLHERIIDLRKHDVVVLPPGDGERVNEVLVLQKFLGSGNLTHIFAVDHPRFGMVALRLPLFWKPPRLTHGQEVGNRFMGRFVEGASRASPPTSSVRVLQAGKDLSYLLVSLINGTLHGKKFWDQQLAGATGDTPASLGELQQVVQAWHGTGRPDAAMRQLARQFVRDEGTGFWVKADFE
jgi:hypothetical protein